MKQLLTLLFIGLTSLYAQTVPSYVPTNGLVGWWPFNGNANDESGNGNNGVVNGATLTSDRFGITNKSYSFDGVNDFIDITNTTGLSPSVGISLSIWTKDFSSNGTTNHQYLYLIGSNPNARITIADNFELSGSVLNCNCSSDLVSSNTINPTNWTHVVLTYNLGLGEQKLYINGVLVDTKIESMTSYYSTNNNAKRFGSYGFNSHYFKGILDDAALWNRTLNSQEVLSLYNGGCLDSLNYQPQNFTAYSSVGWANFECGSSDTAAIYQWQQNSGAGWSNLSNLGNYTGTTSDSLVITGVTASMNNFGYRCIVESCTTDTSDVAVLTVVNGIGLGESTLQKLTVSPNPTNGIVSLNISVVGTYELLTLDGRVLESGTAKKEYDLSFYPTGIYTLSLTTDEGIKFLKVIKN